MSVAPMSEHEREEIEVHEQRALGFWLYLMGDAVIFALLFATYAIMIPGTAGGPTGKQLFELDNAAIETALLLVSSMKIRVTLFLYMTLMVCVSKVTRMCSLGSWVLVLKTGSLMLVSATLIRPLRLAVCYPPLLLICSP